MDDETRAADALASLQAMSADRMEYKADIATAVLDIDNRDVTTLFSVDCLDSVGDITQVSAFKRSIDRRGDRIPHLYMHDLSQPAIARIVSFQPLTRAELPTDVQQEHPDARGGMACVSRYLKSGRGAEVYDGIKEGIPYQASFGYQVVTAEHKTLATGRKARVIKELRLFEVSTTAPGHAANDATRVRAGKALAALEELKVGWRHGKHEDIAALQQAHLIICELLGIPSTLAEPASLVMPARTSEVDEFLADLDSFLEVAT